MNKFLIPTHLLDVLDESMLDDICLRSINSKDYVVEEDHRGHNSGQYIKLITDNVTKYICLSRNDSTVARNTFIMQNVPSSYQAFLMDNSINKEFEYYVRDVRFSHPTSMIFAYKVLLTANIKILNIDKIIPTDRTDYDYRTPFIDFKQMRKMRIESSERNTGNCPTLFEETNEGISVYGKTYGVNGRETTAICMALKNLVDLPIKVYNVNETDPQHQASVDPANRYILEYLGIEIDDGKMDFEPSDEAGIAKRDQKRYHYNLLQKFKEKKCYLCGCDIEYLIIGSHIHRVTDILHSNLSEEEKQKQIIDGDNGFWLCANHDKLFEWGLIYFEGDKMKIRNNVSEFQKKYIYESTFYLEKIYNSFNSDKAFNVIEIDDELEFHIKPEHYNENMKGYLEIHKNRSEQINNDECSK